MKIYQFILKRLITLIPVLIGLTILTFTISHMIPADPARQIAGVHATAETVERIRVKWGFDKPLPEQYLIYMKGLLTGDLGLSSHTRHPVSEDLITFIPATMELALVAMFIMIFIGIPLGVTTAVHKDKLRDHLSRLGALAGVSLPAFWVALVLQLIFYKKFGLLPAGA